MVDISFKIPYTEVPSVCCTNCFKASSASNYYPDIETINANGFMYNTRINLNVTMINWSAEGY